MSKDDVSLDDELLLVTEKKSSSSGSSNNNNNKVSQKKHREKSPKRDEEDGEASGSGEDSDQKNGNNNKRKPKTEPKKPLKKRKTGDSSGSESSDDDVYDDGWDDDLMGDDADRAKLLAMPMIEREAILDERYTKRKELREAWNVKRRLKAEQRSKDKKEKKENKDDKRETNKDREIRDRVVKKSDSKGKALSELKKKRAKAGYKKSDSEDEADDGEVERTKDDEDEYVPKKSTSSDSHASRFSKSKDDDEEKDKKEKVVYHSDDDEGRPITLEEVEKLRLGREVLEKWVNKPFFKNLVPGFFVRIGIGMDPTKRMNVYRLAQIDEVAVKTSTPYLFNGKQTNKWLRLMIGDRSKDFRMETISNRPVTESEYKHWRMQMKTASMKVPTSLDVPDKLATLATAKNYSYTSEDIQQMLEEKKNAGYMPVKLAAEKARLGILRDTCTNAHDRAELEKKIAGIDELVKEREKKRGAASVANINQRNKQYNFVTTLESKVEEKSGNSDTDPFSRRRTLPRITYSSKQKGEEEEPIRSTTPPPAEPISLDASTPPPSNPSPSSSAASSSSSAPSSSSPINNGNPLKVSAGVPEVKTSEHDTIDIDIPLLSSTPAPSRPFLPSHSLPSSSTPSNGQPEKKSKPTLSLDDYMRRRRAME